MLLKHTFLMGVRTANVQWMGGSMKSTCRTHLCGPLKVIVWKSDLFKIKTFNLEVITDQFCIRSLIWSKFSVVDASSKGPSGLLMGNNYNFGDFDECAKVHEPFFNIYGKYVVVKFGFRLHKKSINITAAPWKTSIGEYKYPPPESSAWEVFEVRSLVVVWWKDKLPRPKGFWSWPICRVFTAWAVLAHYSILYSNLSSLK